MKGIRLVFNLDTEQEMFEIIELIENQNVVYSVSHAFSASNNPSLFSILLPIDNTIEAVYLSLSKGCISINKLE